MDKYDLFCMTFLVLDRYWDKNGGEELGQFLSDMSPFIFNAKTSANPAVYSEYCKWIENRKITVENSFDIVLEYIDSINITYVKDAFKWIAKEEWTKRFEKYLKMR